MKFNCKFLDVEELIIRRKESVKRMMVVKAGAKRVCFNKECRDGLSVRIDKRADDVFVTLDQEVFFFFTWYMFGGCVAILSLG